MGSVASIETFGLVDGPGIRTVVFLNGCKLRCIFCHNPEMLKMKDNNYTPEELTKKIIRNKPYFKNNGGVTFSGGEPLLQSKFLIETCKLLKKENIHITLDTAGVGNGDYEELLNLVDLVIFDIKAIDKESYQFITNNNIEESLNFLKECQKLNKKMWLRQVIIPGINDTEEYIYKLKEFIKNLKNIEKVELLPYHTMAIKKYENMNIPYKLVNTKDMDIERCKYLENLLKEDLWKN